MRVGVERRRRQKEPELLTFARLQVVIQDPTDRGATLLQSLYEEKGKSISSSSDSQKKQPLGQGCLCQGSTGFWTARKESSLAEDS